MASKQSSVENKDILLVEGTSVDGRSLRESEMEKEGVNGKQTYSSSESSTELVNTNNLSGGETTTGQSLNAQGIQVAYDDNQAHEEIRRGPEILRTGQAQQETITSSYDCTSDDTNSHGIDSTIVSPLQIPKAFPEATTSSPVPLCLPSNHRWNANERKIEIEETVDSSTRGHVKICNEGKKLIESIGDDLVVVACITGPARSGKSFLLSQFHDQVDFEVGHSQMSHTMGIWAALSPEKIQVGQEGARLLLLDAEGLDAACTSDNGGSDDWDRKLFSVCMLLSSYMIYNCQCTPRASDLDKLGVIAQFSEAIYYNTQEANIDQVAEEFQRFSPHFLWLIRDERMKPVYRGIECSWDEFLEKTLLTCKKNDDHRNAVRKAIKRVFQTVRAQGLPVPVLHEDDFAKLSQVGSNAPLSPRFLEGVQEIKSRILSTPKIKRSPGFDVNGKTLNELLTSFVSAVNKETDKLEVVTLTNAVTQSQINSGISKAIQMYKNLMEIIELPAEEEKLIKKYQAALVDAHEVFSKSVRRIYDQERCTSSKAEISKRMEILFEEQKKRNNIMSKEHCLQEMKNRQKEFVQHLKENVQNYGCKDLQKGKEKLLTRYRENAKGPMADRVQSESLSQIADILSKYRDQILVNPETKAESIYKEDSKLPTNSPLETNTIEDIHRKAQTRCFEYLSSVYDQCEACERSKNRLCKTFQDFVQDVLQRNFSESRAYCEQVAKRAMTHFEGAEATFISCEYSFFQRAKFEVLEEYNQNAKGPAKEDVKKKCETDLDEKLKVIEKIVQEAALENSLLRYENQTKLIIKGGPYEETELRNEKDVVAKKICNSFLKKCEGIDQNKIDANMKNLKRQMELHDEVLFLRNEIKSREFCDQLSEEKFEKYTSNVSELLNKVANKCFTEPFKFMTQLQNLNERFIQQYLAEGKGPSKTKALEKFKQLIYLKRGEILKHVTDYELESAIENFNETVEDVLKTGLLDESDIVAKLKVAASSTVKMLDDGVKDFEELYVKSVKGILERVVNILKENCLHRYKGICFQTCEALMSDITQRHNDDWKRSLLILDFDNATYLNNMFEDRQRASIEEYKSSAKGPFVNYFLAKCTDEINRQISEIKILASTSNLYSLLQQFRTAVEINIIRNMPLEVAELESHKVHEYQNLLAAFTTKCEHADQDDLHNKEKMLKEAANDILSKLDVLNQQKSREYCQSKMTTILDSMLQYCTDVVSDSRDKLLNVYCRPMQQLQEIKANCLQTFDQEAKGPEYGSVRESCCDNVDKHLKSAKKSIMVDALEKATNMYSAIFDAIRDESFLNKEYLDSLKRDSSEDVKNKFNDRCNDSNSETMRDFQENLTQSINQIDIQVGEKHTDLSREHCQNVSDEIMRRVRQSCENLVLLVEREHISNCPNVRSNINSIRNECLAQYNERAKGSEKNNIKVTLKIKLEKELDDVMKNTSKHFLYKCVDRFTLDMTRYLGEVPQDEELLSEHCEEVSTSTVLLFQEKCQGFDESLYASDVQTLRHRLIQAKSSVMEKNEYLSLEFCSTLLKNMQSDRKKYIRRKDYYRTYRRNAKGPMIEQALSNYEDPIETHYKSWYGIFSKIYSFGSQR